MMADGYLTRDEVQEIDRRIDQRMEAIRHVARASPAAPYRKQSAYRARNVAAGLCERCATPRGRYARNCDACQATFNARQNERNRLKWTPAKALKLCTIVRTSIESNGADREIDAETIRAGVVMFVGFLFGQDVSKLATWAGYDADECQRVAVRLVGNGIWVAGGRIACTWMEGMMGEKRLTKKQHAVHDLAFWLDAMVGQGALTRTDGEADDDYRYGLSAWLTPAVIRARDTKAR